MLRCSIFLMVLLVLVGCDSKHLRLTKYNPDEFETTQHPPLEIPDSTTLRDPAVGVPRPQYRNAADRVKTILGSHPSETPRSLRSIQKKPHSVSLDSHQAERSLLSQAGADRKTSNIRRIVDTDVHPEDRPNLAQKIKQTITFWKDRPRPGRVIDPQKEHDRLAEQGVLPHRPRPEFDPESTDHSSPSTPSVTPR